MIKLSEFIPWDGVVPEGKHGEQLLAVCSSEDELWAEPLEYMYEQGWRLHNLIDSDAFKVFGNKKHITILGYHRVEIVEE